MKGQQTHFFATRGDLEQITKTVESDIPVQYVRSGLFDNPRPTIYHSFLDYEDFGVNRRGQATNAAQLFLVMESGRRPGMREAPQFEGGVKYGIDQMQNPDSISFSPSGFYDARTLIAGKIATISNHPVSTKIYSRFRKAISRNSTKVGYAHVFKEAMEFMKSGGRMVTMGIDSPPEYDLKF